MSIECLPEATFARLMYTESRRLSLLQVAEKLLKDYKNSSRTLHTDGTSKFGKHYGTYDVVTDQGQTLTAGIREVSSGDTKTQLNVLIDIFSEIEESLQSSEENVSNKIISSIKNIMSDRHIVQKKINAVFQNYRASVLPTLFENWDTFSENIQENFIKFNDFFCGLHFLVGLADQTEIALKAWDKLLYDDRPIGSLANGGYSKGESGTLRLIRTTCKSVQTHGCEKSRRISDFYTYLTEEVGFLNLPFICFKGNRSNVLFYNGGILYYLHDHLLHFFDIVKDDNKLLKAVHSDLQIQSCLCGCRALGLINL